MRKTFSLAACLFVCRLLNAASVKDFGATGNGSTDDTAAIQNAVNAITSGTLTFPAGNYKIAAQINLKSNVTYQGQSTVLLGNGNHWLFSASYDTGVTIDGFIFDNGGLLLQGAPSGLTITNNTFRNLTVDHTGGDWGQGNAIFAGTGVKNSVFRGNTFKNLLTSQNVPSNDLPGNTGMMIYGADRTSIDHNTFDHMVEGMHICFTNDYPSTGVYIGYNTFTAIHRMGLEVQGPYGCAGTPSQPQWDTTGMIIEYNSFTNPLSPYWWTYPISLSNPDDGNGTGGHGAIVRYNYIVSTLPNYDVSGGKTGIGLEVGGSNTQIYGNTLVGPWWDSIVYASADGSTIHDNWMCGIDQGATVGIGAENSTSGDVTISNNTIYANSCPTTNYPNPTIPVPPIADGTYSIWNAELNNLVLDIPDWSYSPGLALELWAYNGTGAYNQKWIFTQSASNPGYYTIKSDLNRLYLTAPVGTGPATQDNATGDDRQLWYITSSGGRNYPWKIVNKGTGMILDDAKASKQNGAQVLLWNDNGGANQHWAIKQR